MSLMGLRDEKMPKGFNGRIETADDVLRVLRESAAPVMEGKKRIVELPVIPGYLSQNNEGDRPVLEGFGRFLEDIGVDAEAMDRVIEESKTRRPRNEDPHKFTDDGRRDWHKFESGGVRVDHLVTWYNYHLWEVWRDLERQFRPVPYDVGDYYRGIAWRTGVEFTRIVRAPTGVRGVDLVREQEFKSFSLHKEDVFLENVMVEDHPMAAKILKKIRSVGRRT